MQKWTNEQALAITSTDCDLLVSAAAGSGKTAVLTERIITKCTSLQSNIDNFLIVTFTNAAASEMRQRISQRLSQELENNPQDENILRQLTLINKASITTIHSFCLDLIRNNFHLLDIDPAFRIADQTEADLLKLQAVDEVLEEMYAKDEDKTFARLAEWLGTDRSDEVFATRIVDIYEFIRSFPNPLEWLNLQVEKYNLNEDTKIDALEWITEMKTNYFIRLDGLISAAEQLIIEAEDENASFYLAAFKTDLMLVSGLRDACEKDWQMLWNTASVLKFPNIGKKPKDADEELVALLKNKRDKIKKEVNRICDDICYLSPESIIMGLQNAHPLLLTLKDAISNFEQTYTGLKKERSMLDFGDFEHLALHLLIDQEDKSSVKPSALALQMQQKYHEIFVDEYQDCNGVQETIFNFISKKVDEKSVNMFMVGDVKQSIYRFRQADPTIFMKKQNFYTHDGLQRKIMLNKNFRSRIEVLNCVNHIFTRIMSPYAGEMEYGEDEQLYLGANYIENPHCKPELLLADTGNNNAEIEQENDGDQIETGVEFEARMVANRINQLIESGFEVYDSGLKSNRRVRYSDMVILMRATSSRAEVFESEFEYQGIPYYTDTGGGYLMSLEVRVMLSLLKVIDNPLQDIPLIGVLRSPIFGFNGDELLEIRTSTKGQYYFNCMQSMAENDLPIGVKCKNVLKLIDGWRAMAVALPTHLLIQRLLDQTNYYSYAGALPNGEIRQANLRILYERAKQYEQTDFRGLFNFISYIAKVRQYGDMGGAKTLSENCDVVRIMSIHKSKGLEFPVVFVCGVGSRFNLSDSRGALLLHRELGIGADFVDRQRHIKYRLLSKLALAERIRMESVSEEMRILYVALTRAKEKLIITGVVKNANEKLLLWEALSRDENPLPLHRTAMANSFSDWLCACISKDWIFKIYSTSEIKLGIKGMSVNDKAETHTETELKPTQIESVSKNLEFVYPHIEAIRLPSKLSVTELKRRFNSNQDENGKSPYMPEMLERPKFLEEKRGLNNAEYGTAVHLVLRHTDLDKEPSNENVQNTINKLVESGFMTNAEALSINPQPITDFLCSSIGIRMRTAKNVQRELSFNMEIEASSVYDSPKLVGEKILVQGIIDCLFLENDGCVLIDYKVENPRLTEMELKERYATQMRCYKLAAEKITKTKVKAVYLHLLTRGKSLEIEAL